MKMKVRCLLAICAVAATIALWCMSRSPSDAPPAKLLDFANETAKRIPNCQVHESRHGLPQCWLTTAEVTAEELKYKRQWVDALDEWRGIVIVRNTQYGIVVTFPLADEVSKGCAASIGDFTLWGDPQLIGQIKKAWRRAT